MIMTEGRGTTMTTQPTPVDPGAAYAVTRSVWGDHRTAVTVLAVTPARPGALVEIEAVAALPEH